MLGVKVVMSHNSDIRDDHWIAAFLDSLKTRNDLDKQVWKDGFETLRSANSKFCEAVAPPHMLKMQNRESRRSTRVPLRVVIAAQSIDGPLTCGGETVVVNRHGALILCSVPLRMGLRIEIHVILTDKRAPAEVVYVDPERPLVCGIALNRPENTWGLSLPPDDWYEHTHGV